MGSPGAGPGPSSGGGAALPTERGRTAKKATKLDWQYPVFKREVTKRGGDADNGTVARAANVALPYEEAILYIAGEDRRPLIILRECKQCNGTDDALLSRQEDNTRTLLMTRWFRCVKLPMEVLEDNHPFHALFEEEHPPHLFITRWDGSDPIPLRGDRSRSELWGNMQRMLESEYLGDSKKALKQLEMVLNQYDVMDQRIDRLEQSVEEEIENAGPKSRKLKKLRKDLAEAEEEMERLKKREQEVSDLKLKYLDKRWKADNGGTEVAKL